MFSGVEALASVKAAVPYSLNKGFESVMIGTPSGAVVKSAS